MDIGRHDRSRSASSRSHSRSRSRSFSRSLSRSPHRRHRRSISRSLSPKHHSHSHRFRSSSSSSSSPDRDRLSRKRKDKEQEQKEKRRRKEQKKQAKKEKKEAKRARKQKEKQEKRERKEKRLAENYRDMVFESVKQGSIVRLDYFLFGEGAALFRYYQQRKEQQQQEGGVIDLTDSSSTSSVSAASASSSSLSASSPSLGPSLDMVDDEGRSLLELAVLHSQKQMAEWLLRRGASLLHASSSTGNTALHLACTTGDAAMAQLLVRHGAPKDVANRDGLTPVDMGLDELLELAEEAEMEELQEREREYRWRQVLEDEEKTKKEEREWQEKLADACGGGSGVSIEEDENYDWTNLWADVEDATEKREAAWFASEEEYREGMVRAMNERRRARESFRQERFTFVSEAQRKAQEEQKKREEERKRVEEEIARQIEEHEKAMEEARRSKAQQVEIESQQRYEERWESFIKTYSSASSSELIRESDVPFPVVPEAFAAKDDGQAPTPTARFSGFLANILHSGLSAAERKKILRQAYLRWHPDKFLQAFSSRLHPDERERILDRVTHVAQYIGQLKEKSDALP